jgi:hypothetical protein
MKKKHAELKGLVAELRSLKREQPFTDTLYHDGQVVYALDLAGNRRELGTLEALGLTAGDEDLVFSKVKVEGRKRTVWPAYFAEELEAEAADAW